LVSIYFGRGEAVVGLMQGLVLFGATIATILSATLSKYATIYIVNKLLAIGALAFFMLGAVFMLGVGENISYTVLIIAFFIVSASITIIGIIAWSYLGEHSPENYIGKIMALSISAMNLGAAIGNFIYGRLLARFIETPGVAMLILAGLSGIVAVLAKIRPILK